MANPLILYSVNTYLAWWINENYYGGRHYVWCTDVFDVGTRGVYSIHAKTPGTSTPSDIYRDLQQATVVRPDLHNAKIARNRDGIMTGAHEHHQKNGITTPQRDELLDLVARAQVGDFIPLVYVIPYQRVSRRVRTVPLSAKAHPMSREFIIEELLTPSFDILRFD